jgi:predicted O-methyltransferase YrrM
MRASARTRLQALAPSLHPNTLDALADMYDGKPLLGTESEDPIALDKTTRVSPEQGAELRKLMIKTSSSRSLEVGFAYGFSTLWMLDALRKKPNALHVVVDPYEKVHWRGIGLRQVDRIRFEGKFKWLQEFSFHALSDLIRQREKFDFIFIDGNHRFDDVIVDFYLCDRLMRPEGLIIFDDMWMPSIQSAASFVITNRSYEVERQPAKNMLALRKVRDDDRSWAHFEHFLVRAHPLAIRLKRTISTWMPKKFRDRLREVIHS